MFGGTVFVAGRNPAGLAKGYIFDVGSSPRYYTGKTLGLKLGY